MYVLIDVPYTVSHFQLFLEPYAVSQVLAFSEVFPLSPGYPVPPSLRCRSILLNLHKCFYTMTCLLKTLNKLNYCLTNMCLASFCACAIRTGQLMTYKHTYTVGIHLANTRLAVLAPITFKYASDIFPASLHGLLNCYVASFPVSLLGLLNCCIASFPGSLLGLLHC